MKKEITNDEMFEQIIISIQDVAEAFHKIKNSRLSERVILLLIKDITGQPLQVIEGILKAAASLKDKYLKK